MIHALILLFGCQLVGEVMVRWAGLPVPGPVLGLCLLLTGLLIAGRIGESLDRTATGFVQHLSLLFVPAGVGVIQHVGRLQAEWVPLAAAMVVSTASTIAVSALVFWLVDRWVQRRARRREESHG